MISEAQRFWDAIAGKVKQAAQDVAQNTFRCERYEVTTAPNGYKMGVTLPLGTKEIFLPYSNEVSGATVGSQVLVVWWGSMSNAKVYYYANGYDGGSPLNSWPVGAIYESTESTSPAALFGGDWLPLDDGRVLIGANSTYAAGSTGGDTSHTHTTGDHTLTTAEMPAHTHLGKIGYTESGYGVTIGTWSAYIDGGGTGPWGASGNNSFRGTNGSTTYTNRNTRNLVDTGSKGGGGAHNHGDTGSGSNMQPYLSVYRWKRIA